MQEPKTYYIRRGEFEYGPYTVVELNAMRGRQEINGNDLARSADSDEFRPLASFFPHMGDYVGKSREQHQAEARITEGKSLARMALGCAIGAWFIAGPILSVFAIVLGIKSLLRTMRVEAVLAVLLGVAMFGIFVWRFMQPYLAA